MKCVECGKKFNVETRYNPSTDKEDSPYITYMHGYSFNQVLSSNGKGICKNSQTSQDNVVKMEES